MKTFVKKVFNKQLDYSQLMNLNFDPNLKIKEINKKYNSIDVVDKDTILLHTSNRITHNLGKRG